MITTRHLVWILAASVGCATPMSAVRDDNRRLTQSVAELRADRRAQDRKIRDLEHQLALAKEVGANASAIPQLPIEVVAPPPGSIAADAPRVVGVSDDGGEVVYEGDAALGKPATLDSDDTAAPRRPLALRSEPVPTSSDRIEVTHRSAARPMRGHVRDTTPTPAPTIAATPPATGEAPASEYRAAVELVKTGKQPEAITALRAFLQHYPRHDYADNAQYWIGEAFYAQKDYPHALLEFRATIESYPRGNKVPDALLKVGYCYQALGQPEKAHAVLEQVVSLYPKSEPAGLAAKRLEKP